MKTLENEKEKIQKISDQLRNEVIAPAQKEASDIIEEAKRKADQIISEAEMQAKKHFQNSRHLLEQEKNVFQSSLQQASKQSIDALKQSIEHHLFNDQLDRLIDQASSSSQIVANLVNAIIHAIEKEGLSSDLTVSISKTASVQEVNKLLAADVIKHLKEKSVTLGDFDGGVKVKFIDKKMTIDMSDETLKDLLSRYVRKDFRKLIFGN
jgi:V/A-type H+-transporting ATPase subunit E